MAARKRRKSTTRSRSKVRKGTDLTSENQYKTKIALEKSAGVQDILSILVLPLALVLRAPGECWLVLSLFLVERIAQDALVLWCQLVLLERVAVQQIR